MFTRSGVWSRAWTNQSESSVASALLHLGSCSDEWIWLIGHSFTRLRSVFFALKWLPTHWVVPIHWPYQWGLELSTHVLYLVFNFVSFRKYPDVGSFRQSCNTNDLKWPTSKIANMAPISQIKCGPHLGKIWHRWFISIIFGWCGHAVGQVWQTGAATVVLLFLLYYFSL